MSKIKTGGLDQYGAEPFEQQQFGTAGIEGVKIYVVMIAVVKIIFLVHYHLLWSVGCCWLCLWVVG